MNIRKYIRLWWILTNAATQISFSSRLSASLFIIGKLLRYISFILLIFIVSIRVKQISGYTFWQMVFFFMSFNLIDTVAQFFLRDVYRFRNHIVSGYFDYVLTKPFSALFKSLFGGSDILDFPLLILSIAGCIFVAFQIGFLSFFNVSLYILLVFNAFFIALSFHIFVLCLGIITTEVDNAIMLYRDMTQMGRIPTDLYKEPIRGFITFIIPVGIMMTFPTKAFMGMLSIGNILLACIISVSLFILSLKLWKLALKNYTSAGG